MAFGIYVHIPYCLQRCSYCDFSTYEFNEIPPPEEYVELLKKEIRQRSSSVLQALAHPKQTGPAQTDTVSRKVCDTIYFGGGTPSLIEAPLIVAVLDELANQGFEILPSTEITIEINPATIDVAKLEVYKEAGINRFSVGAQTFNDELLKSAGRRHCAKDTVETLELLNKNQLDFTFDLLFALPKQTLAMLDIDLEMVKNFAPSHLSTYCLTVPENHPMQKGRAPEEEQIEMFQLIENRLREIDLELYEISNFAKPGKESHHNLLYWTDQSYWGIGLSAHSYFANSSDNPWGLRFWNLNTFQAYKKQIDELQQAAPQKSGHFLSTFKSNQYEKLELHQSLTDYCHTFLRLTRGLDMTTLEEKFSKKLSDKVLTHLHDLSQQGLIRENTEKKGAFCLTPQGRILSNQAFSKLTFLKSDI